MTAQAYPENSQATPSLVVSIVGLVCCGVAAPVAWYMAQQELAGIAAGRRDPANEGTANAARIIGIIGTVFLAIAVVWIVAFGGLAIFGGLSDL